MPNPEPPSAPAAPPAASCTAMLLAAGCATNVKPLPEDGSVTRPAERYEIGTWRRSQRPALLHLRAERGRCGAARRAHLPAAGGRGPRRGSHARGALRRGDRALRGVPEKPDVVVIVRSFGSQRAYVGGEVKVPSMVMIDGRTSVVDAVASHRIATIKTHFTSSRMRRAGRGFRLNPNSQIQNPAPDNRYV